MEMLEVYKQVFDTLGKLSLNAMIQTAYDIMQMPIVITDAAFIVLEKYPLDLVSDEQWDDNTIGRQIHAKYINHFQKDQHWPAYEKVHHTLYLDWGFFKNSPRYSSHCQYQGKNNGFIAALATGIAREDWHIEAFDIIAHACAIIIEACGRRRCRHEEPADILFQALLRGELKERSDFELMYSLCTDQLIPGYAVVAIESQSPSDGPLITFLDSEITAFFGNVSSVIQDGCLYVLLTEVRTDFKKNTKFRSFLDRISGNELQCGVSRVFTDLYPLDEYKWQADEALRMGRRLNAGKTTFHYDDYIMDIIASTLSENSHFDSLVHPLLIALSKYDRLHDTEYFTTLETYLLNGQDKAVTARELHIHRNTLTYRLEKIKAIGEINSFSTTEGLNLNLSFLLARANTRLISSSRQ